jgi:hypothetical protein
MKASTSSIIAWFGGGALDPRRVAFERLLGPSRVAAEHINIRTGSRKAARHLKKSEQVIAIALP